MVKGEYYVADCEHYGDIERDKNYLRSIGCEVTDSYWDGHDCGEAYISFTCSEKDFPMIYKKLGSSASFDADINKYIQNNYKLPYTKMNANELHSRLAEMKKDLSIGFWDRLPLHLFFEISKKISPDKIIETCLSYLKEDKFEVIGYATKIVDGCEYMDVLIKTSYKNLTCDTIGDNGFGDYCIGDRGWIGKSGIYGECACNHIFCNKLNLGYDYEYLQRIMNRIVNGKPLMYKRDNLYDNTKVLVESKDYFKDGAFMPRITINGKPFVRLDPRSWDCR